MPAFDSLQIPPPSNWEDFENICCDLFRKIWNDPNAVKNGRQRQPQNGVDIYGRPDQQSKWAGVQCKKRDYNSNKSLTKKEIDSYIEEAKSFEPAISQFIICTTAKKDSKIEEYARTITDRNTENNLFSVHVWGWEDIQNQIAGYPELVQKYWPIDPKILEQIFNQYNPFYIFNDQWLQEQSEAEYNLRFYDGFQATWGNIMHDHDIIRDQFSEVFEKSLNLKGRRALLVILAKMGVGKSIFLKRLAVELYKKDNIVLYHKESIANLTANQIIALAREINSDILSKKSIYIFIDNAARFIGFQELVNELAENGIKAVILAASNIGEWQDANFILTGNLDCDPIEIRLSNQLSSKEAEDITQHLQKHVQTPLKPAQFLDKNFLIAMMQATSGKGFKEIIKGRIQLLSKKNPILLTAYLYTCLLSQYGLPMPISLLQALLPKHDLYSEILSEPLFKEVIKYTEDSFERSNSITAGNELYAITVTEQQFADNQLFLIEMLGRIVRAVPAEQQTLAINLLLNLGQRDSNLAHEVIKNCQEYIDTLQNFSTADEFSRGWAKFYTIIKDYETAEKCYLLSLEKEENSHSLSRYSWFLKDRGRFLDAKKYLELAVTISPDDVGAHSMLGRLLKSILLYEKAAREFEIVLQKSLTKRYICSIGPIYLQILKYLKQYKRAIEICNQLIDFNPSNKVIWSIMRIQLFLLSEELQTAADEIIKILEQDPGSVKKISEIVNQFIESSNIPTKETDELKELIETYMLVDQITKKTGQFKDGIFEKQVEPVIDTEIIPGIEKKQKKLILKKKILSAIQEMKDNNQVDAIPGYLDSIIEQKKYNTIAQLEYADYLITYKNPEDAENHLIAAIVYRNPEDFKPILHYACYLARFKCVLDARSYFLHSLNILNLPHRTLLRITLIYVLTLIKSNNYNESISNLLQIKVLFKQKQNLLLADILKSFGSYHNLEKLCKIQLENHHDDKDLRELISVLVIALTKQQRYKECIKYHKTLFWIPASEIQLQAVAACVTYLARHRSIKGNSGNLLDFALRFGADNPHVMSSHIEWHFTKREFKAASKKIDRLISSYPQFGLGYALQGQLLSWQGNTSEAYSAFEQGIKVDQDSAEVQSKYAYFLMEESKFLERIDKNIYSKFIDLAVGYSEFAYRKEPTNLYISNIYASVLLHAKKTFDADKIMQEALNICADNVFVLVSSANIKATLGLWDDALPLYYRAIDAAPVQLLAYAHGALGRAFLSHRNLNDAKIHLDEAQIISKFGSKSSLDIGDWYLKCGNLGRAKAEYIKAINRAGSFVWAHLKLADLLRQKDLVDKTIIKYAACTVEFWEMGRMLASAKTGHSAFSLLCETDDEKLNMLSFSCGILSALALYNNPYTMQVSSQIIRVISKKLTEYPNLIEAFQRNEIYLKNLILFTEQVDANLPANKNIRVENLTSVISSYIQQITK